MIFPLAELLNFTKVNFSFLSEAVRVFEEDKTLLTDCLTLVYRESEGILTLSTNASQVTVCAVMEQRKGDVIQPLSLPN
ncbi:unnamed protein product [Hymenolepis diminuta]|uniref:Uncharacterized protein n=1 Tax=Hymenolepis diminuta TaxID=6216 RepID=A0A564YMJ8_HYMDI|nr:unnamed protein product [Hymenolepis diminuta]